MRAYLLLFAGDLDAAGALVDEIQTVTEATGSNPAPYGALAVAALRGERAEASTRIEATIADVTHRGEGIGVVVAERANAVLNNGLGRYREAMAAAHRALGRVNAPMVRTPGAVNWAATEFVEAAVRSGEIEAAKETLGWITAMTSASGTDWALGIEARSARWSATTGRPNPSTVKRSTDSPGPASAPTSPVPSSCTANGSADAAAATTPASNSTPPTTCSPRSEPKRSPDAPAGNSSPPAKPPANALPPPPTS